MNKIHLRIKNEADYCWYQEPPDVKHRLFDLWMLQSIKNGKADERTKDCVDEKVKYRHSSVEIILRFSAECRLRSLSHLMGNISVLEPWSNKKKG